MHEMKTFKPSGRGSTGAAITILILLVLGVLIAFFYVRSPSLQNAFHSVKDSSQDAATASKVRTALLLSKNASAFDIKVQAKQGEVTLTGQVPSPEIKAVAGAIAQDTSGVKQLQNNIVINPSVERDSQMEGLGGRVADLEIKTVISDAFLKSTEVKDQAIEAQVSNRVATLSGTVQAANQKYVAEQITWQVSGVQGVINKINVSSSAATPEGPDEKLARRVEFELYSTKAISVKNIQVHSQSGTVTLTGSVASRAEKLLAEKVAQTVEGVRKVVNNLTAPEEVEQ
jgi:hyperosmotically inducible periplasmic protein